MQPLARLVGICVMAFAVALGVVLVTIHTGPAQGMNGLWLFVLPAELIFYVWPLPLLLPIGGLWSGWRLLRVGVFPTRGWRIASVLLVVGLSLYVFGSW